VQTCALPISGDDRHGSGACGARRARRERRAGTGPAEEGSGGGGAQERPRARRGGGEGGRETRDAGPAEGRSIPAGEIPEGSATAGEEARRREEEGRGR